MRRRWRGRVEAVEASDAVLAGDDGARLRVPADWLPGAGPGDSVHLALRHTRRRVPREGEGDDGVTRHAPWLDTLSLVALAVGVAALVYHLFLR
jgi:hypothetical protein